MPIMGTTESVSDPRKLKNVSGMTDSFVMNMKTTTESVVNPGLVSLAKPLLMIVNYNINRQHLSE
jgi:hypothetical protein